MKNILQFVARDEVVWQAFEKPVPASTMIPDWWKNAKPYEETPQSPSGRDFAMINGNPNFSFKKCVPMLDPMMTGYIIPLWADVYVERSMGEVSSISWKTKLKGVFADHHPSAKYVESPPGYSSVFKYLNGWIPVTPKGYSILVTAPFGYRNLPFQAIPGIIDSDTCMTDPVIPGWFREDFSGLLEKGTPMAQIIPFKRSEWKSTFGYLKDGDYEKINEGGYNTKIFNHYMKNHWKKKIFD